MSERRDTDPEVTGHDPEITASWNEAEKAKPYIRIEQFVDTHDLICDKTAILGRTPTPLSDDESSCGSPHFRSLRRVSISTPALNSKNSALWVFGSEDEDKREVVLWDAEEERRSSMRRSASGSDSTVCPEKTRGVVTLEVLETELARQEQDLTSSVPELLEAMNASSQRLNDCESRLAEEEKNYYKLAEACDIVIEELHRKYGHAAVERARPYFEVVEEVQRASDAVQGFVRQYGDVMASCEQSRDWLKHIEENLQYGAHDVRLDPQQQEQLSKATLSVMITQQERDHLEINYATVLGDFQNSQKIQEERRKELGKKFIEKLRPCFNQIKRYDQQVEAQRRLLETLVRETEMAKNEYNDALRSLEGVNNSVHALRDRFTGILETRRRLTKK